MGCFRTDDINAAPSKLQAAACFSHWNCLEFHRECEAPAELWHLLGCENYAWVNHRRACALTLSFWDWEGEALAEPWRRKLGRSLALLIDFRWFDLGRILRTIALRQCSFTLNNSAWDELISHEIACN